MTQARETLAALLILFLGAAPALAQKLDRFEEGIKPSPKTGSGPASSSSGSSHGSHGPGDELAEHFFAGLVRVTAEALIYGGYNSMTLVDPEAREPGMPELIREPGGQVLPFVELDAAYQDIGSGVVAWDYRGEVGYGFLGFSARRTFYRESDSDLELDTLQYHGLYRMTFGESFELDMGFGALEVKGEQEHVGFSFALPMRWQFVEGLGVEYRPVWSTIDETRIYDNDLALVLGWRYLYLRAGYRWFYHAEESLSGPQVGISCRW
jgi:hypothetical protein